MSGPQRSAGAVLERRARFGPELASAGAARRLLRELLADADRERWRDAGELALSEVVTNAALHAHTDIEVRLAVRPDHLRVEVRDFNPLLPVQRHYDEEATTGRGMALVAALSLECGVESLGDAGKVAWFHVGDRTAQAAEEPLATWDVGHEPPEPARPPTVDVVLDDMPVTLWLSARQHHDAILRELVLYLAEHDDVSVDLPSADMARGIVSSAVVRALEEAHEAGTARPALPDGHPSPLPWVPGAVRLVVGVPADAGPRYGALQDTLDLAERLAVEGRLLTRPALPEIVAVRDWACEQVIAQLSGAPPAPWPGTAQERFETDVHDRADRDLGWDATTVAGSDQGVVAADDANRIIAVSRPLADLVGWAVDDLVGRRVVTLIPPALREAHVAGFSRHLSSGESHILGVPLELPVLRADGTEIMCHFLVERAGGTASRAVYLAWIAPAG